jgi:hypothetical protein
MLLVMCGVCEGVSLRNSRIWAGLDGEQAHRAGQDVRDAIHVFFKMADVVEAGLEITRIRDIHYSTEPDHPESVKGV